MYALVLYTTCRDDLDLIPPVVSMTSDDRAEAVESLVRELVESCDGYSFKIYSCDFSEEFYDSEGDVEQFLRDRFADPKVTTVSLYKIGIYLEGRMDPLNYEDVYSIVRIP